MLCLTHYTCCPSVDNMCKYLHILYSHGTSSDMFPLLSYDLQYDLKTDWYEAASALFGIINKNKIIRQK